MDAATARAVRRRFTAALAGGYGADWYDQSRHDPQVLEQRFMRGQPINGFVGDLDPDRAMEQAYAASRPVMSRIRAEARRRGVPGA
jgi:hypothetical protein